MTCFTSSSNYFYKSSACSKTPYLVAKSNIEVSEVTKAKDKEIKKIATKLAQAEKNAQIEDKKSQLLLKKKI